MTRKLYYKENIKHEKHKVKKRGKKLVMGVAAGWS